jgi:hypothetical protein
MKVRSPITFRNKAGSIVFIGDPVDAKELEGQPLVTAPEPYETKVVRQVAADEPRAAITSDSIAKASAKAPAKTAARKTAKKAR